MESDSAAVAVNAEVAGTVTTETTDALAQGLDTVTDQIDLLSTPPDGSEATETAPVVAQEAEAAEVAPVSKTEGQELSEADTSEQAPSIS